MKQLISVWLIVLVCLTTVTGCSRVKQLNMISFVTAIGIDKAEDSGIVVHALIAIPGRFSALSPGAGGSDKQSPNYILSKEGSDVAEALSKMKRETARDLDFGHTRILLFSDELAKQGIEQYLDLFMRREEFQNNAWIAIGKGSTKDILQAKPEVPQSVNDYWVDVFSQAGSESMEILPIYLYQFNSYIQEPGKTPFAMEITMQEGGNQLRLADLGLFRKGKMVGTLTPVETAYLQLISGNRLRSSSLTIDKRNYTTLKYHSKKKITGEGIKLDMSFQLELDENPSSKFVSLAEMHKLEAEIADQIESNVIGLIKKLQELKLDPVGFGEKYRIKHGGELQEEEWLERIFPEMSLQIKVTVNLERKGMLT
ncbi:MAG: Ger(x)C family spore germination protein [Candidatus Cohnella colombiensis]|uniref:Ger(X)C family spore germination protein n=1 Tax=Candidatus Cohnella colombiensis TaxID=3121368 RepID=A0AA95EY91_9BACL|nr:MAG: Ger(x)C family spore germination protein [Cohnella sp.]